MKDRLDLTKGTRGDLNFNDGYKGALYLPVLNGTPSGTSYQGQVIYDSSDDKIKFYDGSSWIEITSSPSATVTVSKSLDIFVDLNARFLDQDIHGNFSSLGNYNIITGPPTNVTNGLSKLFFDVATASDSAGSFTITGTSVNRDTGAETASDTEVVTIAGTTTDNSTTDANGNVVHEYVDGYITSKWWKGAVVITTSDLTIESVNIWQVAFEQFNDKSGITLQALDVTAEALDNAAELDCYLYSVVPTTGNKCDITKEAGINLTSVTANLYYRLRQASLNKALDGTTDGIFVNLFLLRDANQDWADINLKVWYDHEISAVFA